MVTTSCKVAISVSPKGCLIRQVPGSVFWSNKPLIFVCYSTHYQNVVVADQPSSDSVPHTTVVQPHPRANDSMALTLVLIAICLVHGNLPAFLCLIPALLCSYVVSCTYVVRALHAIV